MVGAIAHPSASPSPSFAAQPTPLSSLLLPQLAPSELNFVHVKYAGLAAHQQSFINRPMHDCITTSRSFNSDKEETLRTEGLWKDCFNDTPRWWDNAASQIYMGFGYPGMADSLCLEAWHSTGVSKGLSQKNGLGKQGPPVSHSEKSRDASTTGDLACSTSHYCGLTKIPRYNYNTDGNAAEYLDVIYLERRVESSSAWEMLSIEESLIALDGSRDPVSIQDAINIVQRCRKEKNLAHARCLHLHSCNHGLSTFKIMEDHIVPMFVECGGVSDAELIFHRSAHRGEYSLTSLILGYVHCGKSKLALKLYTNTQEVTADVSIHTLSALLKACIHLKDVEKGQEVHTEIVLKGLETDVSLGSSLISMYSRCGLLLEAHGVLHLLPVRDVVTWTALITGYAEHGPCKEALKCFDQLKEESLSPSAETFVCTLKACSRLGATDNGREIHSELVKKGFDRDPFIGSILVCMYAKGSSLIEAHKAFDQLLFRDVVSWNALIAGYTECGALWNALACFEQMCVEGHSPDAITYASSLRACSCLGALKKGQEIHIEVLQRGFESDISLGNGLVDMYIKFGSLMEAQKLLDTLPARDAVSWTSLIAGFVEHGLGQEAWECFQQMSADNVSPDAVTYACIIRACCSIEALDKGQEIHMAITQKGFDKDASVGSTLVSMYSKCGLLAEAHKVLNKLLDRNVVLWTALITGYTEFGPVLEALNCFRQMQLEGIPPNSITFSCVLKACGVIRNVEIGQRLHMEVVWMGFEPDLTVGNTLVAMYSKLDLLSEAQAVFDMLMAPDAVSWNALIAGYAEHGPGHKALGCYEKMQVKGFTPDTVTFSCVLKACGSIGALEKGREIHMGITENAFVRDLSVGNSLINMYTKCGSVLEAWEVFVKLPVRDVVAWSSMIAGYGLNHDGNSAVQYFEDMQANDVSPDLITFTCLLTACSHASLVCKGQDYFKTMREKYGVLPSMEHFTCMVDLLARSGHLYEAERFLLTWCPHSEGSWVALLSACRTFGETELGLRCFQELVDINPEVATWYTLMIDVYVNAGRLECANGVEKIRKHVGAFKKPATAMIEVNKKMYEFQLGNKQSNDIVAMLNTMRLQAKDNGHVPNVDLVLNPDCDEGKEAALCEHAERLAIAFGLLNTPQGETLRVTKNLRMCNNCHDTSKMISRVERREIILRDESCVHKFKDGLCSCGDNF